ncbi:MAG: hypothetical protein PUB05_01580 [Firmicutes bacterium]|nr:hypothetical protein [Bacillota bacterium]
MKKLLSAIIAGVMMLSLASCGGTENNNESSSSLPVNEQFLSTARTGMIGGAQFGIGADPDDILSYHHFDDEDYWNNAENADKGLQMLNVDYIGGDKVRMYTEDTKYYYLESDKDSGIYFVAYFGNAYGYTNTTTDSYIKATAGISPVYEGAASDDDLFFLYGGSVDTTMLAYSVDDKYDVDFYFFNGMLIATTIQNHDSARQYGVSEDESSDLSSEI